MALVQTTAQLRTQESGASSNLAFGSNVTAGSALFLYIGNYPSGISSVSDSQGNTWQKADGVGDGGINFGEIWYALNAAAGATTITISPTSGSGNYLTAWAQEWSGVQTSGALDRTGTATNTNTVSTSLATQQADELVLTVAVADTGAANINWGTPTDYTLVGRENDSNSYTGLQAAYRVVAATGTQSATHTVSGIATSAVDAVIATFRLASTGSTYNESLTEVGSASESLSNTATRVGSVSESGSAADSLTNTATLGRSVSESATASDSLSNAAALPASISESGTAAEALSDSVVGGSQTYNESVSEAGSASDSLASTATLLGGVSEAGSASDAPTGVATLPASLGESASAADSLTAQTQQTHNESLTEAVSAADEFSAPAARVVGGGGSPRRGYIYKGQRYYLTPEELAVLIAQDVIAPAEVKQVSRKQKAKAVDPGTWAEVEAVLKRLEKLAEPEDDDEEEEALLLLI